MDKKSAKHTKKKQKLSQIIDLGKGIMREKASTIITFWKVFVFNSCSAGEKEKIHYEGSEKYSMKCDKSVSHR